MKVPACHLPGGDEENDRIASDLTKIFTKHLLNENVQHYHYISLLCSITGF
jgi:hypothetical protein